MFFYSDQLRAGPQAKLLGYWRVIRFCPDSAAGEQLNVGVMFRDQSNNQVSVQMLADYGRICCAYGDHLSKQLPVLLAVIKEDLIEHRKPSSGQIALGDERLAEGDSPAEILERAFAYHVPLGKPTKADGIAHKVGQSTLQLRSEVYTIIQREAGVEAAKIIPQVSTLEFADGERTRFLDVPLQGPGKFGTLVSVRCKDQQRNLANSALAVEQIKAAASKRSVDKLAVFMLRPAEGSMPAAVLDAIDASTNQLLWMFKEQGLHATAEISAQHIAEEVMRWGLDRKTQHFGAS